MKHLVVLTRVACGAFILSVAISWSTVQADDQATYESLSEVTIGRVFFSPEQRSLLEKHRSGRTTPGSSRGVKTSPTGTRKEESAGFIVNSDGQARIYSNGDFVAAVVPKKMAFPGDVVLVRQKKSLPNSDEDVTNDTEVSDADD